MYLAAAEIKTHLYGEKVDTISREDDDILKTAVSAAIAEAKSYLSAFDTEKIFDETGADRNPILLLFVKDIAVWHFIQLANPNVDLNLRLERYEKAIAWLDKIMRGQLVPDLPTKTEDGQPENNFIRFGGNRPRRNYF